MPAASTFPAHRAAPRGTDRRARRTRPSARAPDVARVRWDRLGRLALLCVLVALVYLYVSAGFHMFSTWQQSRHDKAAVAALEREHRQLTRQHEALSGRPALEEQARRLGMIAPREQPYVVTGLPDN